VLVLDLVGVERLLAPGGDEALMVPVAVAQPVGKALDQPLAVGGKGVVDIAKRVEEDVALVDDLDEREGGLVRVAEPRVGVYVVQSGATAATFSTSRPGTAASSARRKPALRPGTDPGGWVQRDIQYLRALLEQEV